MRDGISTENNPPDKRGRLLSVVVLHLAAGLACFVFLVAVPVTVCIAGMIAENDPGGPMFFPVFIGLTVAFAVLATPVVCGAALLSKWLRRRHRVPLWLPPAAVFVLVTWTVSSFTTDGMRLSGAAAIGIVATLAFVAYWAAISNSWLLTRLLSRHSATSP